MPGLGTHLSGDEHADIEGHQAEQRFPWDASIAFLNGVSSYIAGFDIDISLAVMVVVTTSDVESKLKDWAAGRLSAALLHAWAEERHATSRWCAENEQVNEVLSRLDMLNVNLTTDDDVPILLAALTSANPAQLLEEYGARIDMAARRKKLAQVPFYARFCESNANDR